MRCVGAACTGVDDVVAKVHAWGDRKRRFSQRQILLAQDVLMKQISQRKRGGSR